MGVLCIGDSGGVFLAFFCYFSFSLDLTVLKTRTLYQINQAAQETGWSFLAICAGAVADHPKDTQDFRSDPCVQSFVMQEDSLWPDKIKVALLRHGAGAPAEELVSMAEPAELHLRLVSQNLRAQLLQSGGRLSDRPPCGDASGVSALAGGASSGALPASAETLEAILSRAGASAYLPLLQREEVQPSDLRTCVGAADLAGLGIPPGICHQILRVAQSCPVPGPGSSTGQ
mmetsp:Transcript_20112/g.47878  ORF Transcript_20112/g.47878 Transcript_20112/m.47878 type:complete len:230 (-) Transcript_20112:398-1087(-)